MNGTKSQGASPAKSTLHHQDNNKQQAKKAKSLTHSPTKSQTIKQITELPDVKQSGDLMASNSIDMPKQQASAKPRKRKTKGMALQNQQSSIESSVSTHDELSTQAANIINSKQQDTDREQSIEPSSELVASKCVVDVCKKAIAINKQKVDTTARMQTSDVIVTQSSECPASEPQHTAQLVDTTNLSFNSTSAESENDNVIASSTVATKDSSRQTNVEELDNEFDAGIELDGSSNSGGSVRDMCDAESAKLSSSISPVDLNSTTNMSLGNTVSAANSESFNSSSSSEASAIKSSSAVQRKEKLAATLEDMDADEERLQSKLTKQNKDKTRQSDGTKVSGDSPLRKYSDKCTDKGAEQQLQAPKTPTTPSTGRRFSAQLNQEASTCRACSAHVYQMERLVAEKSLFHKTCFKCCECNTQLTINNYMSHEGEVYCRAHHRLKIRPQTSVDNENDVEIVAKSSKYTLIN